MNKISVTRFHTIEAGHRVYGHEGKCLSLHGHGYKIHFTCTSNKLDSIGRVIDFGVIKQKLCAWLEFHWDHKFLLWSDDPLDLESIMPESVVRVPFNPTAENMAQYLVEEIGPQQLDGTGVKLVKVIVEETRKCSASYEISR